MNRFLRLMAASGLAMLLLLSAGCNKLRARDQLNKGVQAFKNAKYEQAIQHFQSAEQFDPHLAVAKLYLATAYRQQWVPGVDSKDNNEWGRLAVEEYKSVLLQPTLDEQSRVTATKGIADIYFNSKKFDDAKKYQREVLKLDPKDAETYYSIGVIDWTVAFQQRQDARAKAGLQKPDDRIKDKKACAELRAGNEPIVNEGIDMLEKAMGFRDDYDDATAYLNLLYREKAHLECDDEGAYTADIKKADEYVDQTMGIKKKKAEKAAQAGSGGVVLDDTK
jgi:tetratricopeptide (TPR) repeat protein